MIDHASKVHWDGNKEESGAYLIAGIGPGASTEVPKSHRPVGGRRPLGRDCLPPDQIPWRTTAFTGPRIWPVIRTSAASYVQMLMLPKGGAGFSRPHFIR